MINTRYTDGNEETCTANIPAWSNSTLKAAEDDECFKHFRRDEAFMCVIEGSPKLAGLWNLRKLKKNTNFISTLPILQLSESVGSPLNLIDFVINNARYSLNPTTLRYANNVCNYIDFFGEDIFNNQIYEIGGGMAVNAKY